MSILFLDDNAGRLSKFASENPEARLVMTVHEAIDALQSQYWDEVWLDHDLGGEIFVDSSRADCGMEVVRWITTFSNSKNIGKIIVHTANQPAAVRMETLLNDYGYHVTRYPFDGVYDYR